MTRYFHIFCILLFAALLSCGVPQDKRQQSFGDYGKIMVVVDKQYEGIRGAVEKTLGHDVPGLFFGGREFQVMYEPPKTFDKQSQKHRNILVILDLDDDSKYSLDLRSMFAADLKDLDKNAFEVYAFQVKDKFAFNQDVFLIAGYGQESIQKYLSRSGDKVRGFFEDKLMAYLHTIVYEKKEQTAIQDSISKTIGVSLRIPQGFRTAVSDTNFVWLRNDIGEFDILNLVIAKRSFENTMLLSDSSIYQWRNELGEKYILGPESHMVTDKPFYSNITENGLVELRGNWKMTGDNFMGGNFVSRAMTNAEQTEQYYIEGFMYYPFQHSMNAKRHEEYEKIVVRKIKQIEAILNTFNLSQDE